MSSPARVALVTGATSGLGYAAALELAQRGLTVIVAGRDERSSASAARALAAASGSQRVEPIAGDLSRQTEVHALAAALLQRYHQLDVLVHNAGAGFASYTESADGIELTWAINYLAPFLLTRLLRDALQRSDDARVITVTSSSHRGARIQFDDPGLRTRYTANRAYGQSKLAGIMFTAALARRHHGTTLRAYAVDPGPVRTELFRRNSMTATANLALRLGMRIHGLIARPPTAAAQLIAHVATAPAAALPSGTHWVAMRMRAPAAAALRHDDQERLWALSEQMTGTAAHGLRAV